MQVIKTKIRTKCQVAAVKADGFVYKGRMKSRVFGRRPPVAPRQFDQFLLTSPSSLYSIPQLPFISFFLAYSELLWRPLGEARLTSSVSPYQVVHVHGGFSTSSDAALYLCFLLRFIGKMAMRFSRRNRHLLFSDELAMSTCRSERILLQTRPLN